MKKQTSLWLSQEAYEWLRQTAFDQNKSQAVYIEELILKEKKKDERRNDNNGN